MVMHVYHDEDGEVLIGRQLVGPRHECCRHLQRHMLDSAGNASLSHGPFLFSVDPDPTDSHCLIEAEPDAASLLVRISEEWELPERGNLRGRL